MTHLDQEKMMTNRKRIDEIFGKDGISVALEMSDEDVIEMLSEQDSGTNIKEKYGMLVNIAEDLLEINGVVDSMKNAVEDVDRMRRQAQKSGLRTPTAPSFSVRETRTGRFYPEEK